MPLIKAGSTPAGSYSGLGGVPGPLFSGGECWFLIGTGNPLLYFLLRKIVPFGRKEEGYENLVFDWGVGFKSYNTRKI